MADPDKKPAEGVPTLKQQYTQLGNNLANLGQDADLGSVLQVVSANWFTAEIDLAPQFLKDFQKDFNDLSQTLVTYLETLNQILDAVKAFIAAYANPIQTIATAIVQKIQAVINDIRQIGFYLTGDWGLFKWPLNDLRGGYAAYQQRMTARLTDASDPTRPNVSEQTYVLGVFFYISTDISQVYKLIRSIQQLLNLFSFTFSSNGIPACSPPRVRYGYESGLLVASFRNAFSSLGNADPLTIANLEWSIDRPSGISPVLTFPLPPPQGFIVEVSTVPGLLLMADRVSSSQGGAVQDSTGNGGQPRETKIVLDNDNNPVLVMGGADLFAVPGDDDGSLDNNSISTAYNTDGTIKAGKAYYYLAQVGDKGSTVRIPPDLLKSSDGTYYLQRTFLISQKSLFLDPAIGRYRFTVAQKDLPHNATFTLADGKWKVTDEGLASKYYVRVSAISNEADADPTDSEWALKYDLQTAPTPTGNVVVTLLKGAAPSTQRGKPSPPITLTFPSQITRDFLVALKTALALLVLTRADLKVITKSTAPKELRTHKTPPTGNYAQSVLSFDNDQGTGLERFASGTDSLFDQLVGTGTDKTAFFLGRDIEPSAWANSLADSIENLAEKLYKQMGNLPAIENLILSQTVELRTATLVQIYPGLKGSLSGSPAYKLGQTTIFNSLKNTDPNGEAYEGDYFGAASSIFQANEAAGVNPLTYYGLPDQEDFPYLWYQPPKYKLLAFIEPIDLTLQNADRLAKNQRALTTAEVVSDLEKSGYVAGSKADYEIEGPNSDVQGWLKVQRQPANRQLFQAEGWPVIWQAQTQNLSQHPATESLSYVNYRTLMSNSSGLAILQQAEIVLNVAAAVSQRSRNDGAWISYRFFDNVFGGALESVLLYINNFVKAINNAFAATVQVIIGYIEFLQARIRELQSLIQLINYYVQQIALLVIPKAALLITVAPGTTGTLSAFLSAGNKPQDGPVSYGAGLAVIFPLLAGTKFIVDIITAFQKAQANAEAGA